MKAVCKKHGYAYEVSEGCGDCKGIANVRALLDSFPHDVKETLAQGLPPGKILESQSGTESRPNWTNGALPVFFTGEGEQKSPPYTFIEKLGSFDVIDCSFSLESERYLKAAGHGVDEATAKAFRESKVTVDQEYLRQLKAQSFLHMANTVAQFLSEKYGEYGLDEADALNLVEHLDEVASKIEIKESEIHSEKRVSTP
jgi:hypothetical protein